MRKRIFAFLAWSLRPFRFGVGAPGQSDADEGDEEPYVPRVFAFDPDVPAVLVPAPGAQADAPAAPAEGVVPPGEHGPRRAFLPQAPEKFLRGQIRGFPREGKYPQLVHAQGRHPLRLLLRGLQPPGSILRPQNLHRVPVKGADPKRRPGLP